MAALILAAYLFDYTNGLDNGLVRTPPMGWLSWERFRCETDCTTYPDDCINEKLYQSMGDHLVSDGWLDVGYDHINVDDCWSTKTRDPNTHEQVPDPDRFPNGIKGLAKYMHDKGLKLGLYSDIGNETCGGYTGMYGYYDLDAKTFASWDIDMLKVDGCHADEQFMYLYYPNLMKSLNDTGRDIVYSCSWPAYIQGHGETMPPVYNTTMAALAENCNLWRNYGDVQDSWDSVKTIMKYWARDYNLYETTSFLNVAGPGNWNDPDMIIGGSNGLSKSEVLSQIAIWSIVSAPLLLSDDLRSMDPELKTILQNKEIIAVNQDPMGKQGGYIYQSGIYTIWIKELTGTNTPLAIVMQNEDTAGFGQYVTFQLTYLPSFIKAWNGVKSFTVRNIVNQTDLGTYQDSFRAIVGPSSVNMYRLEVVS